MIFIHLGALLILFVTVLVADHYVFSWIRGKKATLSEKKLHLLHTLVWAGLISMVVSGAWMAWPLKDYFATSLAFYIKMAFVLALVINGLVIGTLLSVTTRTPFAELTPKERLPILISGAVSTASWVGAFIAALFMTTSGWLVYFFSQVF